MLTTGFTYAIGVYYVEFLAVFNKSNGQTAWISSLKYGIQGAMGKWNYLDMPGQQIYDNGSIKN